MPPSRDACAGSEPFFAAGPCSGLTAWAAASGSRRERTSAGPSSTAPTGPAHSIGDNRMHELLQEGHATGTRLWPLGGTFGALPFRRRNFGASKSLWIMRLSDRIRVVGADRESTSGILRVTVPP